jgi:hypothetical protein
MLLKIPKHKPKNKKHMPSVDLSAHKSDIVSKQCPPYLSDAYDLRVVKATFAPSKKSGNPMITLGLEIIRPQSIERDGKTYDLTSLEPVMRLMLWQTDKFDGLGDAKKFLETLGLPLVIDTENPDLKPYEGLCFRAFLGSEEITKKKVTGKNPDGSVKWEPILDEETKQPIKMGWQLKPVNGGDVIKKLDAPKPY